MRLYTLTDLSNETVDLDDPTIYEYLPNTSDELFDRMCKEIGYALSYMDFIHRDVFPSDDPQRIRVLELIAKFWREEKEFPNGQRRRLDVAWMKEQVYIFEDETENMC